MPETSVRKKTTKKSTRKRVKKVTTKTAVRTRKAPTSIAVQQRGAQKARRIVFAGIGVFVVTVAISVFIGTRDSGEIVITTVLEEQKKDATPEELQAINNIGVQETKTKKIDGGLVPSGVPVQQPEPEVAPEQTASSSDATASSSVPMATSTETQVTEEDTPSDTSDTTDASSTPTDV